MKVRLEVLKHKKPEQYKLSKKENYNHIIANIATSYIDKSLQDIRFLSSLEQFSKDNDFWLEYSKLDYKKLNILHLNL